MITPFGFLTIFILMYNHIKNRSNSYSNYLYTSTIIILLALTLFFSSGIVMQLNGSQITILEFSFYYIFFLSLFYLFRSKLEKKHFMIFIFAVTYILINNLLILIWPTPIESVTIPNLWYEFFMNNKSQTPSISKYVLIYDVYTLMAIVTLVAVNLKLKKKDYLLISSYVGKMVYLSLLIFVFELSVKSIFSVQSFYDFRSVFMGINIDSVAQIDRGGFMTYFGFNSEPASLAQSLFLSVLCANLVSKKGNLPVFILGSILGFITGSMLFLVFFGLLVIQLSFLNKNKLAFAIKKHKVKIIAGSLVLLVTLVIFVSKTGLGLYFTTRFSNIFKIFSGQEVEYSSELSRITTSILMAKIFINRFVFGAGIGTTYGFSAIFNFLSNYGIVGFLGFTYLVKSILGKFRMNSTFIFHLIIVVFALVIQGNINYFLFTISILLITILKASTYDMDYSLTE